MPTRHLHMFVIIVTSARNRACWRVNCGIVMPQWILTRTVEFVPSMGRLSGIGYLVLCILPSSCRHRHFNGRFLWRRSRFCTLCNSDLCGLYPPGGRIKVLYTGTTLAEMQLSTLWTYNGRHVEVNHENGGTLATGVLSIRCRLIQF